MMSMFGPNGQRVLALIAAIPGLSADQVDQVTVAWKQGSPDGHGRAWANLNRMTDEDERYRILAAASLARREAHETARRADRADWDHYDTLVAPFAAVVPVLANRPALGTASAPDGSA